MDSRKRGAFDFTLFIIIISLLSIGLIMVFSASSEAARYLFKGDAYHYIKRQGLWAILSVVAMLILANFNYKRFQKLAFPGLVVSVLLLVAVLVIGKDINGGKRWIYIGSLSFQPSEFVKIAVVLFFASSLSVYKDRLKYFWTGLLPYLGVLGIIALLLYFEPHFSCIVIILVVGCVMLFVAGAKLSHFAFLAGPAAVGVFGLIMMAPYRVARVMSFLDPFKDKQGDGWQVIQSLYAIGSGGIFGLGLGRSRQKFLYIPEPQNDFIFSILCEELGFIGALVVILLFVMLIYRGMRVALTAPDMFGSLIATGITTLLAVQIVCNIAVVTSSMPVTGMPLPFFSYGGTTLLANMCAMGILLNISRYCKGQRGA